MSQQTGMQSVRVSSRSFERLLAEHPFKDLSDFPGYVSLPHEANLAVKYHRYVEAVRLFLKEKEINDSAFGEMSINDQRRETYFSATGSRDEERRRLSYGSSRVAVELMYVELETVALALQAALVKGGRDVEMLEPSAMSGRRLLFECNRIFAAQALGFLFHIQKWLTRKHARPTHANTLAGGITVLSQDVANLLTADGEVEVTFRDMRRSCVRALTK